jgi:DNA-binding winged helix-turn-helix (wHTH) protein
MTSAAEPPAAIDLAQEADFRLGGLHVSPSTARVRWSGGEQRVEPRVMEVLVVLARHAGRTVTRDQLIDACWGGRIVSDDAVNRVLAQVRGLARLTEPAPFVLETVPKVGVRLLPAEPGGADDPQPPAVTAPALTRPGAAPAAAPRPLWRSRPRALAAVAGLVLVAIAAGFGWTWRNRAAAPQQNGRVEVMQFEARSADPAARQAAADLPQDLVRILSAGGAQVAEAPLKPDDAGGDAELRVTGSVGLEAGKYLIGAQVIDRRSGVVLWSDRLERSPEEQARSPGDFAARVAAVLHCSLVDRKLSGATLSTEAMSLHLNACAGVFFGDDDGERMLAVGRKLAKVAPDFASAYAMQAIGAALLANAVKTPSEAAALHAEARAAAGRALKLDPRTAKAYVALAIDQGVWRNDLKHDWFAEEGYLRQALKYDPELPPARNEYASLLRSTGRITEALEFLKLSSAADDPRYGSDPRVAMLMAATGDLRGAETQLDKMEAHDRVSQRGMRWTILFWWDDPVRALPKTLALAGPDTPQPQACYETYLTELPSRIASHARGLPASCDERVDRNWRIRLLAREGDLDAAFAALNGNVPGGPVLLYYPEMRGLRADPRFWPLVKRIGLVDYWRRSGHWPDFCAEPGLPYDCRKAAAAVTDAAPAPARTAAR